MNWFSELGILRDWPPLALPFAVAFVGELVLAGLMIRSREDRERLLVSAVLLPLHVLTYLLVFHPPWEFFIEIYVFSAPVLALGLIVYLCILCRRKQLNRTIWTAAAIWFLYFAAILFMIVVMFCLAHDMSH